MPVFKIEAETIAEAWEKAVLKTFIQGIKKLCQYEIRKEANDSSKLEAQETKTASTLVVVRTPLKEPRVHRGDTIGILSLQSGYLDEIIRGVKDYYVKEGKWHYTYHERLMEYEVPNHEKIDQIKKIVNRMINEDELFTRRAQAITWKPWEDIETDDPPCLQRIWITIPTLHRRPKGGETYMVNVQTMWRSRDLFNAWEANVNGIIELCRENIIKPLNEHYSVSKPTPTFTIGQYLDFSNDLHIYEKDYEACGRFIDTLTKISGAKTSANLILYDNEIEENLKRARRGLPIEKILAMKM